MNKSVFSYFKKYRVHMIVGPVFKLFEAVVEILIPLMMANILDIGFANRDKDYILRTGGLIILLVIISFFTTTVCQKVSAIAAQGFGTQLRNSLFDKINSLSAKEIDDFSTSSLTTRLSSDIIVLQEAFARIIRIVIRAPFLVIGSIIMAMTIDLKLALIFLIVSPFITVLIYFILHVTAPLFKAIQKQLDIIALKIKENLFGIRLIKAFNQEDVLNKEFSDTNDEYTRLSKRVYNISSLLNPGVLLVINIALIVIVYIGAIEVNAGNLKTGHIIAFTEYLTQIQLATILVVNLAVFFNKAYASKKRVEEVLNSESSLKYGDLTSIENSNDKLEFKNVNFHFSSSQEKILNDISFKIKKGEKIGIIGGTGSGKSVLVQLIARLYDVSSGQILIDNKNITDFSKELINKKVALINQTAVLFSGTLKSNLLMANPDADSKQIWESLEIAQIFDFFKTSQEQLDFPIVEGGKNLSGGQKQRISIARSLLKDSDILILDDSLSALDLNTEKNLMRALKDKKSDCNLIIISQKISSIMHLDKIIVLDKGNIVGINNHKELLASCKIYQEIYHSQFLGGINNV